MLNLIKYEIRKTRVSRIIILVTSMVLELFFLAGVFLKNDTVYMTSISILAGLAFCGIIYIGLESLVTFQKDLNTKQSYMLFMTPNSSYKILGAKILENALAIFLYGIFFFLLFLLNSVIAISYIGGLDELVNAFKSFLDMTVNIQINPGEIFGMFIVGLVSWLSTIIFGDLAIVLAATVFAGKKYNGMVTFILFLVMGWASSFLLRLLPSLKDPYAHMAMVTAATAVISAGVYVLTGWIMDKKLSV